MTRIITTYGQLLVAATFMSFQTWVIVGLMYLIVILLLQRDAKVLERRLKYGAQ